MFLNFLNLQEFAMFNRPINIKKDPRALWICRLSHAGGDVVGVVLLIPQIRKMGWCGEKLGVCMKWDI